jgi:hypothetical protein
VQVDVQALYDYSRSQYLITNSVCLSVCLFVILEGNIYDPADIAIVNRSNGVEENDIMDELIEFFVTKQDTLD